MKTLSLFKIRELAIGSGRAVFSAQQLSSLIAKPKPVAGVYLSRLVNKGMASRVLRGRVSFTDDDFVIATQLIEPSYISLDSALLFHGLTTQVTRSIECVTTRNSINYKRLGIEYHKIPGALLFGYRRYGRGGSYAFVADPAKALIDGLYLNRYDEGDIEEFAGKVDFAGFGGLLGRFRGRGSKKVGMVMASLTKGS